MIKEIEQFLYYRNPDYDKTNIIYECHNNYHILYYIKGKDGKYHMRIDMNSFIIWNRNTKIDKLINI
jgi:hypothetical protein